MNTIFVLVCGGVVGFSLCFVFLSGPHKEHYPIKIEGAKERRAFDKKYSPQISLSQMKAISNPPTGLTVFISPNCLMVYDGETWKELKE